MSLHKPQMLEIIDNYIVARANCGFCDKEMRAESREELAERLYEFGWREVLTPNVMDHPHIDDLACPDCRNSNGFNIRTNLAKESS